MLGLLKAAFFIGALYIFFKGFSEYRMSKKTLNWPVTGGKVISSEIVIKSGGTYESRTTIFKPEIVYSYKVGNQLYRGDKIKYGQIDTSIKSHAEDLVRRYPEGSDVTVFYSPENSRLAVLETGISLWIFFWFGMGAFFMLFSLFAF